MRCSFNLDAEKNLEVLAFNIFSKIFDNGDSLSFFDLYFFFSVADFKNDFNLGQQITFVNIEQFTECKLLSIFCIQSFCVFCVDIVKLCLY